MKKEKSYSATNPDRFFLNTALLLIAAVTSFTLFGRRGKKSGGSNYNPEKEVFYLPGTDPNKASTFYKLRLSKAQFESLRHGGNTLVFQFFYPQASDCGSPTLFAYKMGPRHRATGTPPQVLSYDVPTNQALKGRAQVLGDVQIKISKVEKLISRVTGSKKGEFSNLIFTPKFLDKNPHWTFDISVDGSDQIETCDPSPPAEAY